jgi:hypothetical protein
MKCYNYDITLTAERLIYMPSNKPRFTLRFPDKLRLELEEISQRNRRSVNQEIIYVLEQYVTYYYAENGKKKHMENVELSPFVARENAS